MSFTELLAIFVNFIVFIRYQPLITVVNRLTEVHKQCRALTKQCDRLKMKITAAAQIGGIMVDDDLHEDLKVFVCMMLFHVKHVLYVKSITSDNNDLIKDLPSDSFRRVFWEQQVEAAKQKNARTMKWHPLMIRWCLYLRHRYENVLYVAIYVNQLNHLLCVSCTFI